MSLTKEEKNILKDKGEVRFYLREEPFGWLSNFARYPETIENITYPTNEHFYQSQKSVKPEIQKWISGAPNAYLAMCAGRSLRPKDGLTTSSKNLLMVVGLKAKFAQNPELAASLLETGNAPIHEDSPTDMYWGIKGEDWLGELLMSVRNCLRCPFEAHEPSKV